MHTLSTKSFIKVLGVFLMTFVMVISGISVNIKAEETKNITDKEKDNYAAILNHLTELTQEIKDSKNNRLILDEINSEIINNIAPHIIDEETQDQINQTFDEVNNLQMLNAKKNRIQYLYDQDRAQAFRSAVPNSLDMLSIVKSDNIIDAIASGLFMAVDSYTSFKAYTEQAEKENLQNNWELNDEETKTLNNARIKAFNYAANMRRDYNMSDKDILSEENIEKFVSIKNNQNTESRIASLEEKKDTYEKFGPYWLLLCKSYYSKGDYKNCLYSLNEYENLNIDIYRNDYDYAEVIPLAISSAKNTLSKTEYVQFAQKYCSIMLDNSNDEDWAMYSFAAEVYIELYNITRRENFLDLAYNVLFNNVNALCIKQKELNDAYLNDVEKIEVSDGIGKYSKEEIDEYNKSLVKRRMTELPPIS